VIWAIAIAAFVLFLWWAWTLVDEEDFS